MHYSKPEGKSTERFALFLGPFSRTRERTSFYGGIFTYLSSLLSIYRSDAEENTAFSPYTHNTFPQYCDMY